MNMVHCLNSEVRTNLKKKGYLQWSPFSESTKYFEPPQKEFMINNYRVENLERLLEELEKEGVQIVGELESYEYGKFVQILDPDSVFTKMYEGKTTH